MTPVAMCWRRGREARPTRVTRAPGRRRGEQGSATALTLMLGVSILVLPVMVLVLTLPAWEQRAVDAQDAARSASRALVTAQSWQSGVSEAVSVVSEIIAGDGVPASDVSVVCSGSLVAGSAVSVSVTVVVPAGNVPGLGAVGSWHYTATSTQHVDSYGSFGGAS